MSTEPAREHSARAGGAVFSVLFSSAEVPCRPKKPFVDYGWPDKSGRVDARSVAAEQAQRHSDPHIISIGGLRTWRVMALGARARSVSLLFGGENRSG